MPRRSRPPDFEAGEILDHFVSGFEWMIPTRLEILDFEWMEKFPGELADSKRLAWSVRPPLGRVHAGPRLLEDFLKLESASETAILGYARRWGPLWLCAAHDLPYRHDPDCTASECDLDMEPEANEPVESDEDYDEVVETGTWYDEMLTGWRALSRQARATIRLARRLHDGQLGRSEDWDALPFLSQLISNAIAPMPPGPLAKLEDYPTREELEKFESDRRDQRPVIGGVDKPSYAHDAAAWGSDNGSDRESDEDRYWQLVREMGRGRLDSSMEFQREILCEVLNYWLELAGVRPRLDWTADKPAVQLGGHGLVGALAVQLLFDCSRTDGLAVCTSCGTPFLPGPRRPRRDRNTYCSDCGLRAAARDASARYRQTEKYQATYRNWLRERNGPEPTDHGSSC